jgi:hypothetical protein
MRYLQGRFNDSFVAVFEGFPGTLIELFFTFAGCVKAASSASTKCVLRIRWASSEIRNSFCSESIFPTICNVDSCPQKKQIAETDLRSRRCNDKQHFQ